MNAADILAIPLTEPGRLFPNDKTAAHDRWKSLVVEWHPDRNRQPDATRVVAHLNALFAEAEKQMESGTYRVPGLMFVTGADEKVRRIHYRKHHPFELGDVYYGEHTIFYLLNPEFGDLYEHALTSIKSLKYRDAAMETECARYVPQIIAAFHTVEGKHALVLSKFPDTYMLSDVLQVLGGKMASKHVAWLLNAVLNIGCYLEWSGMTHNAINLETVFVSTKRHSCHLLGGWWYSQKDGEKLTALPGVSRAVCPSDILTEKLASSRLDRLLVHRLGRELLGDVTGTALPADVPAPVVKFLRYPPAAETRKDYSEWTKVLSESFGVRRFVKLDVPPSDIYGE